jgi:hypothetical protein
MIQALPVMHWIYGPDKNNVSIEMNDDKENGEKDNTEKEQGKDNKENIIPQKHFYNKQIAYKFSTTLSLHSGNAIILHHADINTPPPDIQG